MFHEKLRRGRGCEGEGAPRRGGDSAVHELARGILGDGTDERSRQWRGRRGRERAI